MAWLIVMDEIPWIQDKNKVTVEANAKELVVLVPRMLSSVMSEITDKLAKFHSRRLNEQRLPCQVCDPRSKLGNKEHKT